MIPCNGHPFLEYLLEQMIMQGVDSFLLLTGYLGEQIQEYFRDGSQWGWKIDYSHGPVEWDTGRRLWEARPRLEESFLLLYSDNFVPFPLQKMLTRHTELGLPLTIMVTPKSPGNLALGSEGVVRTYSCQRSRELPYVEIGYMIVDRDRVFNYFPQPDCGFFQVLHQLAAQQQICAWIQQDAYHSISDPERWMKAVDYLKPKKILLIDRDGVINRKASRRKYIKTWEEFEWIPGTRQAMQRLACEGFKFIVISNQAGIARGMVDPTELERIHINMKTELAKDGVEILNIYICPHHWDEGCSCRKPNPGMLFQASREHLFRLDKTLFIGDDPRDCQTAWNAGCSSIFLGDSSKLMALPDNQQPDCIVSELESSIDFTLQFFQQYI